MSAPGIAGEMVVVEALSRLAIARGGVLDEITLSVYLDTLDDQSPQLVARACATLAKTPREEFGPVVPAVGTIRELVGKIAREDSEREAAKRLLPAPKRDSDEPVFFCLNCHDEPNGWSITWCPGVGDVRELSPTDRALSTRICPCGQGQRHRAHTYAERCPCLETNPIIARHRERVHGRQTPAGSHS